jgi:uncharacterized protein YcbK (DUF882 family)
VEQDTLREVNGLDEKSVIHPDDVLTIPEVLLGGWTKSHIVKSGDTVIRIAKRYRVDVDELRELNRIHDDGKLRIGQRVVIPKGKRLDQADAVSGVDVAGAEPKWNGKATVVRVRDSERKTMTMFDKRGRVRTYARRTISRLARSRKGKVRWLDRRLIALVGKVAERYPGHTIEIISGYRPHRRGKKRSQHARGKALDFRVRGVENLELYNYLKTFPKVGVGYYPNSTFVHLDVRDKKYMWTDVSGPGEKAIYVRSGEPGSAENPTSEAEPVDAAIIEEAEGTPDPENFPEDGLGVEGEPSAQTPAD